MSNIYAISGVNQMIVVGDWVRSGSRFSKTTYIVDSIFYDTVCNQYYASITSLFSRVRVARNSTGQSTY